MKEKKEIQDTNSMDRDRIVGKKNVFKGLRKIFFT